MFIMAWLQWGVRLVWQPLAIINLQKNKGRNMSQAQRVLSRLIGQKGHQRIASILIGFACFMMGIATPLMAQQTETPESDREWLVDDTITVTAERGRERVAMDTPQSVGAITRESLDEQVPIDLTQALQREPAVGLGPAGQSLSFWQQGFSVRGLGAQRVLTLTDGVRLSGQGTGYGGGSISIYDTFSVDRIELLRGPNAVLYGTDAFGGVINVITRQPKRRTESGVNGAVSFSYDSAFDLNRTGFYIDAGNDQVGAVFGGSYSTNDNPMLADGTKATSGATDKTSGFARVNFHIDESRRMSFIANLSRDEDVEIENTAIPFGPVGQGPLRFTFPLYQRSLIGMDYQSLAISPRIAEFRVGVYWQQIKREFDRLSPEAFFAPPPPRIESVRVLTDDEINTYEINSQFRFDLGVHDLTVGADLGYDASVGPEVETREQLWPFAPISPFLNAGPTARTRVDAEQTRVGFYAQDNWDISPRFELITGFRLDHFQTDDKISQTSQSETGYSGNVAVVYEYSPTNNWYVNLGSGFRAPDLAERYQRSAVVVVQPIEVIGNPNLEAERSVSIDLGSKWETDNFRAEAALFYNEIKDYITTQVIQPRPTIEQPQNVGKVDLYGWEVSAAYRRGPWELFGNGSRTYAPSSEGVIRVDGGRFNYGVAFEMPGPANSDVRLEALGRTVLTSRDETFIGSGNTASDVTNYPRFSTFEIRGRMDIPLQNDRKLRLVAGVRNLTDKVYLEPFFDQVQPERSFYGSAQLMF
jgi:outer membrane receptor protein involved in Fe transport